MAIDASLVVQVNSVGIKESTDLLQGFVTVAGQAESATASLATASSENAKATTQNASAIDKILAKFKEQVTLLGANVAEKNAYLAITKKATEAQVLEAQMLGAQVDAYKQLGVAQQQAGAEASRLAREEKELESEMGKVQAAAMRMNAEWEKGKALNASGSRAASLAAEATATERVTRAEKELEIELGRVQAAALKMNAEWEKGKSLNASGVRAREIADLKATTAAAKAEETQTRLNIQAQKDYIAGLQLKVAMQEKDRGSQEALKATAKGYSLETIEQAKALGNQLKETGEHAEKFALKTAFATVGAKREVLVLAHEMLQGNFSKIPGSFMVLGERVGATGAIFSVTFGLILAGAISVAALAYGLIQASKDVEKFNNSLILTGNAAGVTRSDLESMAKSFNTNKVSIGAAREMLETLVATGVYSSKTIQEIGKSAIVMSQLTGQSTTEVLSFYDGLGDGASKWALKHNKSMGTMSGAQYEYIKKLEDTGHAQEAMAAAVAAMTPKLDTQTQRVGYATMIWQGWVLAIRAVADLVHNFGAGNTLQEDANKAADWYGTLTDKYFSARSKGFRPDQLGPLREQIAKAQEAMNVANGKVQADSDKAAKIEHETDVRNQGVLATDRRIAREREFETKAQYRARERQAIVLDTARELADVALAGKLTTEKRIEILSTRDKIIRQMEEQNPDKKNPGAKAAENDTYKAALEAIKGEIKGAKAQMDETKATNDALLKSGQISKLEQIRRDGIAEREQYTLTIQKYNEMLRTKSPENQKRIKVAIGNELDSAIDDAARSPIKQAQQESVELAKIDASNTEHYAKELERRGDFNKAYSIRQGLIDSRAVKNSFDSLQLAEQDLSKTNPMSQAFDVAIAKVNTLREQMKIFKNEADDNKSKASFDTAKANFDKLFQDLQTKIASIKGKSLTEGLFSGVDANINVQKLIEAATPALKKAGEELTTVARSGQNAGAQLKIVAKDLSDFTKLTDKTAANDPWIGAAKGLADYGETASQVGTNIQSAMGKAFKSAEDSLTTFIRTGKLSFKGLVDTILTEMARIQAQKLISSIAGTSSGGSGGFLGTLLNVGSALFGTQTAAQQGVGSLGGFGGGVSTSGLTGAHAYGGINGPGTIGEVNEKGPEMLTTGGRDYLMTGSKSGTITPADKLGGGGITLNNSPTINIDARSDQAQVRTLVNQAVQQGNAKLVETLNRQRKI